MVRIWITFKIFLLIFEMTKVEIWEEAQNKTVFVWLTLHHSAPNTLGRCMSKEKPGEMKGFLESTRESSSGRQIRPVKVPFETDFCSGHLTHYPSRSLLAYPPQCRLWELWSFSVLIIYEMKINCICNISFTIKYFMADHNNLAGSPSVHRWETSEGSPSLWRSSASWIFSFRANSRSPMVTAC